MLSPDARRGWYKTTFAAPGQHQDQPQDQPQDQHQDRLRLRRLWPGTAAGSRAGETEGYPLTLSSHKSGCYTSQRRIHTLPVASSSSESVFTRLLMPWLVSCLSLHRCHPSRRASAQTRVFCGPWFTLKRQFERALTGRACFSFSGMVAHMMTAGMASLAQGSDCC